VVSWHNPSVGLEENAMDHVAIYKELSQKYLVSIEWGRQNDFRTIFWEQTKNFPAIYKESNVLEKIYNLIIVETKQWSDRIKIIIFDPILPIFNEQTELRISGNCYGDKEYINFVIEGQSKSLSVVKFDTGYIDWH
jgi:hypothetical protein